MAGDDLVRIADQDRIGEAEPPDAVGDLSDLFLGMRSGVPAVRTQPGDRHRLDGHGLHGSSPSQV
jgi:hypothetical protein